LSAARHERSLRARRRWAGRAALCGLVALALDLGLGIGLGRGLGTGLGLGLAAPGAGAERARQGFDHEGHARAMVRTGDPALACARCHPSTNGQLGKRPDHATCFGECHGALPTREERGLSGPLAAPPAFPGATSNATSPGPAPSPSPSPAPAPAPRSPVPLPDGARSEDASAARSLRARTCLACHGGADLEASRFAIAASPAPLTPDWIAPLSHGSHRQIECLRCHTMPAATSKATSKATSTAAAKTAAAKAAAAKAAAPHRRCLECHTGKPSPPPASAGPIAFAMDQCESCHRASPPPSPQGRITVTAAFSHPRHQRYAAAAAQTAAAPPGLGTAGAACLPCHRDLATENQLAPSHPTAASCATAACHDGRAAFAITERCTQCHREAPSTFYAVARPTQRFVHRQHAAALAAVPCQGCHRLGSASSGAAAATAATIERAGHAACASCHAADFGAAEPVICGACHSSTEPWRTLRADRLPADRTEFGARLDHAAHPQPCERCHTLDTASRQLRPPRDHSACTGNGCHQTAGGAAPMLTECAGCHQLELVVEREQQRRRAPWSVRQRFDHVRHRSDGNGAALACASCHTSVVGALARMPTPAKRTCEPCHDGRTAFSVTGVGCNRCHGGVR
jgi:hypothetical protein